MPQQHGGCVYPDAVLRALHQAGLAIDYGWLAWPLRARRLIMRDPLRASYLRGGYIPGTIQMGNWRLRHPSAWVARTTSPSAGATEMGALTGPEEQDFLRRLIQRLRPRNVLVDFATTLPVLDGLSSAERKRLTVSVLTHNLTSRRAELYRAHGQALDFHPLTTLEETALLARADVTVAIQEREAEAFRALLPGKPVITVPVPMPPDPLPPADDGGPVCLFVGGYSGHNLAGLSWLVREVWPLVLKECCGACLHVVGTVGQDLPKDSPSISVLGPMDDLRKAYAAARVALAPLPMGTGLKVKVIEAMAWGRPVVTTSAGAEGFAELERGELAVIADTPAAFAEAILRMLRSPEEWQRVVARQLAWIEDRCTPAQAIAPLLDLWLRPPAGINGRRLAQPHLPVP